MTTLTIRMRKIRKYAEYDVQQSIQRALLEFKAITQLSHEKLLRDIDRVLMHPSIKFYTPLVGDIAGWQTQTLCADMLGSRRWLSCFLEVKPDGSMAHPPRDIMRPLVIEAYLVGDFWLEKIKIEKPETKNIIVQAVDRG
ncbi:MAG: hypothetical protein AAGJ37_00480 [Pseudomonadota bacterium]